MFFKKKMLTYYLIISLILNLEFSMPAFQNQKQNKTKQNKTYKTKPRLTTGIRISCATKRKLHLTYRKSNNPLHKDHYKLYCLILSKVILAAKQLYYNNCIKRSLNK